MMQIDQILSDCESETEATELPGHCGFALFEGIEKFLPPLRFNPDAGVCDFKNEMTILVISRSDFDSPARSGELCCVVDQIPKHLLKADRVCLNEMPLGLKSDCELQ